jgi:hypothetical protein
MADGPTLLCVLQLHKTKHLSDACASHTEMTAYNGNGPSFCFFKISAILEQFYNVTVIFK